MAGEFPVQVYVYDLSQGLAAELSLPLLGRKIDGIWHTGIVVYGVEYFYGSMGITNCPPGQTILGQPTQIVPVGTTQIPQELFQSFLTGLGESTFRGEKYRLLEHNCNNFSDEVAKFLTGSGIPSHITSLPGDVMSTPFGAMIRPFIEGMSVQPSSGGGGTSDVSLPEPYVAPVPGPTAAEPANSSAASHSDVVKTAGQASSSGTECVSTTDKCCFPPRATTVESLPLSKPSAGVEDARVEDENRHWLILFELFVMERNESPAEPMGFPVSHLRDIEQQLPRAVIRPSNECLAASFSTTRADSESPGRLSFPMDQCLTLLQSLLQSLEFPECWLKKIKARQLSCDFDESTAQINQMMLKPSPDCGVERIKLIGSLLFVLTVMADVASVKWRRELLPKAFTELFQMVETMYNGEKGSMSESLRLAVYCLVLQLSVHDAWQSYLNLQKAYNRHQDRTVIYGDKLLPFLLEGVLGENVLVQKLALSSLNNFLLQLNDAHWALECSAALAQYLEAPGTEKLSEVALRSLFRCLVVDEDNVGPLLAATGLSTDFLNGVTSPELQPAVEVFKAILLSDQ